MKIRRQRSRQSAENRYRIMLLAVVRSRDNLSTGRSPGNHGTVPGHIQWSPMEPNGAQMEPMEPKWRPMEPKWSPMEPKWNTMEPTSSSMEPKWSPMEPNWGPMEPKWNPMELKWMPMEPKWSRMEPKGCPMAPNWTPMGHICVSCVPHWVSASSTHGDCGTPRLQAPNLRETATARQVDTCTTTLSIFLMQFDRRQEIMSPIECAGKKAPSLPLDELRQQR